MIILTDQERDRFATYLEQQADTDSKFADQLEKMNVPAMPNRMRNEAAAAFIVAAKLRSWTSETIG